MKSDLLPGILGGGQEQDADAETLKQEILKIVRTYAGGGESGGNTGRMIGRAKQYIKQNYADKALSLGGVAEELTVSSGYLSALFSECCGYSMTTYINRTRMDAAKARLVNTREKIAVIADEVGYENCTYFYTLFKKIVGKTPSEYRADFRQSSRGFGV